MVQSRLGKNGPCEAGALIAVVNDYVFVDKIYSRDASGMGQAGTFWTPLAADTRWEPFDSMDSQCKHLTVFLSLAVFMKLDLCLSIKLRFAIYLAPFDQQLETLNGDFFLFCRKICRLVESVVIQHDQVTFLK